LCHLDSVSLNWSFGTMAKRLLLSVLTSVLGEYVNGLTEENLKLGVWSGKISLHNLELNRNMLDKLNLPVDILQGSLKSLEIIIPWATLDSAPVQLFLDGISLLVSPLDVSSFDVEEVKTRLAANKKYKLQQSDKLLDLFMQARGQSKLSESESAATKASNATFVQQLTGRIVDNLEITVKNIHVCYEDSLSMRDTTFCCGFTLDSFFVSTTDKSWKESFVSRKSNEPIFKTATMNNIGIYWNADSGGRKLSSLSTAEWQRAMEQMIFRYANSANTFTTAASKSNAAVEAHAKAQGLTYILTPHNELSVRAIHNEQSLDLSEPRFDIDVSTSGLNLVLNKRQYHQMLLLLENQKSLEYQQQLYAQRPVCRPTNGPNARVWWKYAYNLIAGKARGATFRVSACINAAIILPCQYYAMLLPSLAFCSHLRFSLCVLLCCSTS
jgi:vacuolar protein sorting-associated protein 13A/C